MTLIMKVTLIKIKHYQLMHSKSDNEEININDKEGEVIGKLFQSLLNRYQNNLDTSMRGTDFFLIVFICCIINVIKEIKIVVDHI